MSRSKELIANALRRRLEEACERIAKLSPREFGEREEFVSNLSRSFAMGSSFVTGLSFNPATWMASNSDCLSTLSALALGSTAALEPDTSPPTGTAGVSPAMSAVRRDKSFVESLHEARRDPDQAFRLLSERYACPLNFAFADEAPVREYLLTRLMVQWRGKIKRNSIAAAESDTLLLQLNLIAIHASLSTDLRFLDALNYYYESIPADRQPQMQNNWLLVSYFALYAQALAAWLSRT
ncbi:MAG: hypothetical protein ABI967_07315 [bacterium]